MKGRFRKFGVVGLLIGLLGVATAPLEAVAGHSGSLNIQVGNPFLVGANCDPESLKGCRSGESMRFMAPSLKVHKGDTLTFDFASFHTASLLPTDADYLAFRGANTNGINKPYSLLISDPDDTTVEGADTTRPAVKANPAAAFTSIGGSPVTCGAAGEPCSYDGSEVVNSGLPLEGPTTFSVTIDANPGESFWVICFVHTHMFLRVSVVDDAVAATTQAEVDAAKESLAAFDEEWARETDAKLINRRSSHITASGQKVYDVSVGQDSHFASLNGFYPKKTVVPKGATVRFHFNHLIYEDHTATMPKPGAFSLFEEFFTPMCDADGDTGADPDTPDPGTGPPCGGNLDQLEVDITSRVFHGVGNSTFSGPSDLEHSGIRGAQFGLTNFDVTFGARSSEKGWKFFCMLHPMNGKVIVKPTT